MSKRQPIDRDMPGYSLPEDDVSWPGRPRYTFGTTLAQVDALARLVQAVSAHGDVVAVGPVDGLAEGTLPQLGQAICDAADAMRALLDQVEGQRLGPPARPGVAESPAAYCMGAVEGNAGAHRATPRAWDLPHISRLPPARPCSIRIRN